MIITRALIESHRKASELAVVQTLKHHGDISVMRTLSECRRVYGRDFINDAIAKGLIVGVPVGNRTLFSIESIIALQELQLQEADGQINY